MNRILAVLFALAVFVAVPSASSSSSNNHVVDLIKSIAPIKEIIPTGDFDATGAQVLELRNVCTAFSINETKKYWMTAEHCIVDGASFQGLPLHVLFQSKESQLAVLQGVLGAPAIKLKNGAAEYGEKVFQLAYPRGMPEVYALFGWISNPSADMSTEGPGGKWTVAQMVGVGGTSGGPVVNEANELVSVHMWGWCSSGGVWCGIGGGTRWEDIKLQVGSYFLDGKK